MFDYFIGWIKGKNPAYLVLEVNNIAFKLLIPMSTYEQLPGEGEVKIFTYLGIQSGLQESAVRLFGFATLEERKLFELLITVDRVGPMMALRILSGGSVAEIKQAVLTDNIKFLERIKGVGTKTAQRIILDLKETLQRWMLPQSVSIGGQIQQDNPVTDAVFALIELGYSRAAAEKAVQAVLHKIPKLYKSEDIIKFVLQYGQ